MSYTYAIIGSGRQGTAAAYDLVRFGDAKMLLMVDIDERRAADSAERLNALFKQSVARPFRLNAEDLKAVRAFLKKHKVDALIGATPFSLNLDLTKAAIDSGVGMTDFGGNSEIVFKQIELSDQAAAASISIVPDCGQVPGMGTTLVLYAMEALDEPRDVFMWDCGLPVHPEPPWNYRLTFSIEGLTNEYYGDCLFIRGWETVRIPALEEYETIDFPEPLGRLEAFTTSGGLTTAARSFARKLRILQNKTLRYPGHFAYIKAMQQLGLLELEPILVDGLEVIPRHLLHTLWDPLIRADPDTRDLIFIHIIALGLKDGKETEVQVDLLHFFDEVSGFTAMEQGTGWHAAILTGAIARGEIPKGVIPVEKAMSGSAFVEQALKRGFQIKRTIRASHSG